MSQYFSFPCQYHSTNAPYPLIHLPPTLYNVSLPALQFSPISTIPPMLHTHSFTYHPHYIMYLSQYFSFPCQYHSTNAPYPVIHQPPTLMFLSQYFSFPCQYHSTNPLFPNSSTCSYQKDKRTKPGHLPKAVLFRK